MYTWVTHMHSHLRGACPYACQYCYVQAIGRRFGGDAHVGPMRMDMTQLDVPYGAGRTIFIEHASDMFSPGVRALWIREIFDHCEQWPKNTYVFQTRNTERAAGLAAYFPLGCVIGTTIETNRKGPGNAPHAKYRAMGMMRDVYGPTVTRFLTIEPVLDFDVDGMMELIGIMEPSFINLGADSKGYGLPEPSAEKVRALIEGINNLGIEIRQKTNLDRILKAGDK